MLASSKQCCQGEIECIAPKILSEDATNEIRRAMSELYGEELLVLIAAAKDGRTVRFLPYGTDISAIQEPNDDATTELLELYVEIPNKTA